MSARYAKTSSRGRAIVIDAVTGCTAPEGYRAGASHGLALCGGTRADAHRAVAAGVHQLRSRRRLAAEVPAEVADDALARRGLVDVHALADQRRPAAVHAPDAARGEGPDAP